MTTIWHIKGRTSAGFATVVLISAASAYEALQMAARVLSEPALIF